MKNISVLLSFYYAKLTATWPQFISFTVRFNLCCLCRPFSYEKSLPLDKLYQQIAQTPGLQEQRMFIFPPKVKWLWHFSSTHLVLCSNEIALGSLFKPQQVLLSQLRRKKMSPQPISFSQSVSWREVSLINTGEFSTKGR